jgi:hypothetical protein
MLVQITRNEKTHSWSVKHLEGRFKDKVALRADQLILENPVFKSATASRKASVMGSLKHWKGRKVGSREPDSSWGPAAERKAWHVMVAGHILHQDTGFTAEILNRKKTALRRRLVKDLMPVAKAKRAYFEAVALYALEPADKV